MDNPQITITLTLEQWFTIVARLAGHSLTREGRMIEIEGAKSLTDQLATMLEKNKHDPISHAIH